MPGSTPSVDTTPCLRFSPCAIIAIGHKILRTIFFMLGRSEHYRDSTTDYEALSIQRNAPRGIKALTKFGFISPPAPDSFALPVHSLHRQDSIRLGSTSFHVKNWPRWTGWTGTTTSGCWGRSGISCQRKPKLRDSNQTAFQHQPRGFGSELQWRIWRFQSRRPLYSLITHLKVESPGTLLRGVMRLGAARNGVGTSFPRPTRERRCVNDDEFREFCGIDGVRRIGLDARSVQQGP